MWQYSCADGIRWHLCVFGSFTCSKLHVSLAGVHVGALFAASQGRAYVCPIPTDVVLPMIYSTDLIRGDCRHTGAQHICSVKSIRLTAHNVPCLVALQEAAQPNPNAVPGLVALQETAQNDLLESAYTLPGLSFSMDQLFEEIRRHYPSFEFQVPSACRLRVFSVLLVCRQCSVGMSSVFRWCAVSVP